MIPSFFITALLLLTGLPDQQACKQLIRQAYANLLPVAPNAEQTLKVTMTVKAQSRRPGDPVAREATSRAVFYSRGGQTYYTSTEADMQQDNQYVVTVFKQQRLVYITRAGQVNEQAFMSRMLAVRDTLLKKGEVTACRQESGKPTYVTLKISAAQRSNMQAIDFRIGAGSGHLEQIRLHYRPGNLTEMTEMTFGQPEWVQAPAALAHPARQLALDAHGKLLPRYAGWELVDTSHRKLN